ncbi:MAG: Redoxin domain protein [Parcubacteria group bacterium GW2011_GWA2_36_10]|nr:MAG: Redoxin domain protein [Parcubacteria group bacterium GW2011_GWA2_36_10]
MQNYKDIAPIKVGDQAPEFTLKNQAGEKIALNDFLNKQNILLIFYPGDSTPGCTTQLCAIRDDFSKFQNQNITVFGINPADEGSHQKFIDKNQFAFDLLIDDDKEVSKKYQATKLFFGKPIINRTVVLINKAGKIIFLKKGTPSDAEILATLK